VNLILLNPAEVASESHAVLSDSRADHLRRVLNVVPGSTVRIGIVDGPVGIGTVTDVSPTGVALHCRFDPAIPPAPPVDLLLALPRPKILKRLWAQLAATGVGRVMVTNAARVERNYFDTHILNPSAYVPLLIEGLQQAQDTRVPVVTVHRQLKVLLEDELRVEPGACRLYADPGTAETPAAALADQAGNRVLLAVGPEGGWTDYERDMLRRHGFRAISMGKRTLRSDTACIALLTLVHAALSHTPQAPNAR
jgi:RsmE family RNA methyltransferase